MKSSNRWLITFGTAIAVLVVLAVVLVLTLPDQIDVELLPEDMPGGVVQRYLLAIEDGDCEEAYSYLSPSTMAEGSRYKTREEWCQAFLQRARTDAWRATIGEPEIQDGKARISVSVDIFDPGSRLLENPVRTRNYIFILEKEENIWKIISPLSPLYIY